MSKEPAIFPTVMINELPHLSIRLDDFDLSNYSIPTMEERSIGQRFTEQTPFSDFLGKSKSNEEVYEEEKERPDTGTFNVYLETEGEGEVYANPQTNIIPGTTVMLDATAKIGNSIKEWIVVSGGVELYTYTGPKADKFFIMPQNDVTIKVVFEETQVAPPPDYSIRNVRFNINVAGSWEGNAISLVATRQAYNAVPVALDFVKEDNGWNYIDSPNLPNGTYKIKFKDVDDDGFADTTSGLGSLIASLTNNLAGESIVNTDDVSLTLIIQNTEQNAGGANNTLQVNFIANAVFVIPPQLGAWLEKTLVALEDLEMNNSTVNGNIVVGGRFGGQNLVTIQGPDNEFILNGQYFASGAFAVTPPNWNQDHLTLPNNVRFYNASVNSIFNSKMKFYRNYLLNGMAGDGMPTFPRTTAPAREWINELFDLKIPNIDPIVVAAGSTDISSQYTNQIYEFKEDGTCRYSSDGGTSWTKQNVVAFNVNNFKVSNNHCTIRFFASWTFNKIEITGVDSRIEFHNNTKENPIKLDCKNGFLQTGPVNDNYYGGFKNYGLGTDPGDGDPLSIRIMTEGDFVTCNFSTTDGLYNNIDFYLIALKGNMRIGHRTNITGNIYARNIHLGQNSTLTLV